MKVKLGIGPDPFTRAGYAPGGYTRPRELTPPETEARLRDARRAVDALKNAVKEKAR